ncbi:hypothetical protein BBJ28_00002797 [Nothophytophthora sp. Chile5]|nr:hypothetical protein BBJ28_00002797 [Nothophytophthora sp. Chile5]
MLCVQFPTRETVLIPIRLDLDIEGYRYIDSFSWNLYEKSCFGCFYKRVARSIQEQVEKAQRSLPWHEAVTSESLHPIFINLRLNDTIYVDRFEWDLSNPDNSPERFAQVVCEELVSSNRLDEPRTLGIELC